jgi:hypothetical protein
MKIGLFPLNSEVRNKGTLGRGVAEKIQLVRKVWAFCHYGDEVEARLRFPVSLPQGAIMARIELQKADSAQ